jgi:dTDP-4-amino-4,6-dideoxygalactose transaminase
VAGAFSFFPTKNLGAYGEGGAIITNDDGVAEFARALRDHGQATRYRSETVGFNYRMDGFQGAVLRIKLERLDEWNARRREHARLYRELLAGTNVDIPRDEPEDECVYHLFAVYVDDRDSVRAALEASGVATGMHYPIPVHLQSAYAGLGYKRGAFPHAERACDHVVSLPVFPEMSSVQVRQTASALVDLVGAR